MGTIEFWYRETGTAGSNDFFFDSSEGVDQFALARGSSDTAIYMDFNNAGDTTWTTTINAFDGEWHHLRFTWDTTNDSYYLYIDGVSQGQKTTAFNAIDIGAYNLIIGNSPYGTYGYSINGLMDEFKIYSTVLGPDPIAKGGNTADADEYLYDSSDDYTFSFDPVDASNRGEYLYLGSDSMVSGFNIDLQTNGATAGSLNLDWEYWNGSSWASLEAITGFTDTTSNLTTDGRIYWTENPTNWRPYSLNGATDLYCIRASLNASSATYSADPVENLVTTDILTFQYLGDVSSDNQTFEVVIPENLWLGLVILPWLVGKVKKKENQKSFRKQPRRKTRS